MPEDMRVKDCAACMAHLDNLDGHFLQDAKRLAARYSESAEDITFRYINTHHNLGHPSDEMVKGLVGEWFRPYRVRDCDECMAHVRHLHKEFGMAAVAAFLVVGAQHELTSRQAFTNYMRQHHELGHPNNQQAADIIRMMERESDDPPRTTPERHPYEPFQTGTTKYDMCGYGALLGTNAFCGRGHDDKVHSILCPQCERRSWKADDIRNGYCGHCHAFTGAKADGE